MSLSFFHVVPHVRISFLFEAEYSIVCIRHILLICLSVDGHLGWLYVLVIMNNAAMNMDV